MTQKWIKTFIEEKTSQPPKEIYNTNKTDVYHIDDICSSDILDWKDYGEENNRSYRYVCVVIDNFSIFGWTVTLKNKTAQAIKDSFDKHSITSKRKPNSIETVGGKVFCNSIFQSSSNNSNIKHYSRNTSLGTIFAERFNRTSRDLLKRPVFETGDGNWIDVLATVTNQYKNRIRSSTKLTPIQASLKKRKLCLRKFTR